MPSVITIRLIRNFEYRTIKLMILKDVDLDSVTPKQLMDLVKKEMEKSSGYAPLRSKPFDCFKLHYKAYGFKSQNLVINLEDDDKLMMDPTIDDRPISSFGVEHEHEISCFVKSEYLEYKKNPQIKW